MKKHLPPVFLPGLLSLVLVKLLLHIYTNTLWGFHRDEFLYLSLGRQLDWGYWSNPPLIGWVSALLQATVGDSLFAIRLFPMLVSCGLMVLVVLMARELGAGRYGQFLAGVAMLLTPANLRPGMLFQPVMPDIFNWHQSSAFPPIRKEKNRFSLPTDGNDGKNIRRIDTRWIPA